LAKSGKSRLQVIDGAITPGTLVAFLLYSQFISQSVSALAGSYTSVKQAQGASERVFELLDKPKEYLGSEKGESIHDFESLEFKNVSFRHNESQEVFSNISFKIFKGEKVALIGPSGSGKTTLIRLMQGLFSPNEGDVVINGKTAESFNDCARRALFATVPQNVSLFRASIIDNLRLENEKLTDDEIIDACKLSNCHEFIRSLENGYQTIVGENGDTLSGGQKQRLAIARALLRGAPVIVLDEATSNLDNDNALRITELIESLPADKTVVIISHTCKSVDACDRSINISDLKGYQPEPYNSEKLPMLA
ncbi:ABC transporter ATP-binding protein, partial [Idiomarina abyssalis]|uniref:ABC transporter ATP-binding protein n=1 Tax=Idiomarina abyssalis TaxID=86102 RepID=UPI00241C7FB5